MQNLKFGEKGAAVAILQSQLNARGASLVVDGDFGADTERALMVFQKKAGLSVDGVAGVKTQLALNRQDTKRYLSQSDYETAAQTLGVSVNVIRAFAKVESLGAGFLGERPVILFERHVFYRLIKAKHGKAFADAHAKIRPSIINENTGGYQGGTAEFVRLNVAATIDHECAHMAASYGAFQIMGENFSALGYDSIDDFVAKMSQSEGEQLTAFVRFCQSKKGLLEALQKSDWQRVFTLYNGKAYQKHGYDLKFLAELRRLDSLAVV